MTDRQKKTGAAFSQHHFGYFDIHPGDFITAPFVSGYVDMRPPVTVKVTLFGEEFTFTATASEAQRLGQAARRQRDDDERLAAFEGEIERINERIGARSASRVKVSIDDVVTNGHDHWGKRTP